MKVTRVITYEGEDEWVSKTLEKSVLKKVGSKYQMGFNTIKLLRQEVEHGTSNVERSIRSGKGRNT